MGLLWGPPKGARASTRSHKSSNLSHAGGLRDSLLREASESTQQRDEAATAARSKSRSRNKKSVSYGVEDTQEGAPPLPAITDRVKNGAGLGDDPDDEPPIYQNADGTTNDDAFLEGGDESDNRLRHCTWQQAAFNIFFYMFGASQIPFAMGQMGWSWGMGILTALTVSSWLSGHYLTDVCIRTYAYSWPDVARKAFGQCGFYLVQAIQIANFALSGVVQVQGSGSLWQQAFQDSPLCQWQWILLNVIPFLLFLQIPSFSGSTPLKIATWLTVVITSWRVILILTLVGIDGQYCYVCYTGMSSVARFKCCGSRNDGCNDDSLLPC